MPTAIPGAAISITIGTATATARIRRRLIGRTFTAGEDMSTTGSSVQAGIDQSEVSLMPPASAQMIGNSNGPQNATTASRRSLSKGQTISPIAARLGRATARTKRIGAIAYAAEPTR